MSVVVQSPEQIVFIEAKDGAALCVPGIKTAEQGLNPTNDDISHFLPLPASEIPAEKSQEVVSSPPE